MLRTLLVLPLLLLLATTTLSAQNSSKSKSKDRFREKDDPVNKTAILNVVTVNSPERDYAPAFYENGIVFVSTRKKTNAQNGELLSSLFFAPFDPNSQPATPQDFSFTLPGPKSEGPVTFSRDFKTAFYTQNNNQNGQAKPGKDGKVHLKIYWAKAVNGKWEAQGELPFCSDDYSCMTPSLSVDGKRIYFASDKPGGYGGYDIYYADRNASGRWDTPVNVGPDINTPLNDISPSVTQAGTLFFASAGHNTLGGRDLFYSNLIDSGQFGEVVNLNTPFNTEADESSIIVDFDGKRGFFVSERGTGYGKADIYSFTIENRIKGIEKPQIIPANILVVNAKTGEPLTGASIHILQPSADGSRRGKDKLPAFNLVPVPNRTNVLTLKPVDKKEDDLGPPDLFTNVAGRASTDFTRYRTYLVLVSFTGFQTAEQLVQADNDESGRLKFSLKEVGSEVATAPANGLQIGTLLLLEKLFSERNKATLTSEAVRQMDALHDLMQQYPAMEIDFNVHTDARGDARMNQDLSDARANNAKAYLVYRGIDEKRITAYGKGGSEPLNKCTEGLPCSDEQHEENNRVEIKIRKL